VAAHAMAAGAALEVLVVAIVDQGVQPVHRLDPHIHAPPAVAAVRPAVLDELLPPERHRPRAAVTRADIDLALVEEFHEARVVTERAGKIEGKARPIDRTSTRLNSSHWPISY